MGSAICATHPSSSSLRGIRIAPSGSHPCSPGLQLSFFRKILPKIFRALFYGKMAGFVPKVPLHFQFQEDYPVSGLTFDIPGSSSLRQGYLLRFCSQKPLQVVWKKGFLYGTHTRIEIEVPRLIHFSTFVIKPKTSYE